VTRTRQFVEYEIHTEFDIFQPCLEPGANHADARLPMELEKNGAI
jgi:hypothetical protein